MAIRVDKAGIEGCIKTINQAIGDLNSAAQAINKAMGRLPEYWEGNAYEKARSTYEGEYKKFLTKDVPETVGSFRNYIDQCMKQIIALDEQLSGS